MDHVHICCNNAVHQRPFDWKQQLRVREQMKGCSPSATSREQYCSELMQPCGWTAVEDLLDQYGSRLSGIEVARLAVLPCNPAELVPRVQSWKSKPWICQLNGLRVLRLPKKQPSRECMYNPLDLAECSCNEPTSTCTKFTCNYRQYVCSCSCLHCFPDRKQHPLSQAQITVSCW